MQETKVRLAAPQLPVRILTGLPVSDLWLVLQNCGGGLTREYFDGHHVTASVQQLMA